MTGTLEGSNAESSPELSRRSHDARALVKSGEYEATEMLYSDVPDTLSQLIRTAFIPKDGHKFIVSDFSAIEARVLSWLAGETWRMEVFAKNGDIYCETASRMFQVPVDRDGENSHLKRKASCTEGWCSPICARVRKQALEEGWVDHASTRREVILKDLQQQITCGRIRQQSRCAS